MNGELAKSRAAEYQTLLKTIDFKPERVQIVGGTIVGASKWEAPGTLVAGAESLPVVAFEGKAGPGIAAELSLGKTIGEGGMGVVRLARQLPLLRQVAVKQLRPDNKRPDARQQLLREAWVTGGLEHPNIVPVYALGSDPDGHPIIVMKRIEGTSWKALIDGSGHHDRLDAADDRLGWHLGLFQQVLNALNFAHSRGIIHRDVKPDNVMVGAFGEVYLLDWGIAVSLDDPTLPLARDIDTIAGTPGFLAPEMAAAAGASIDERTDVYLLGATLHYLVTGTDRHQGSLIESLSMAFASEPFAYDPSVPAELASICNKACAALSADRFQSVRELQTALDEFRRHRASTDLTEEATARVERLAELVDHLQDNTKDPSLIGIEASGLFAACRFGFEQALESWPDNGAAGEGLAEAFELMLDFQIHSGNAIGAQQLLGEVKSPSKEFVRRVETLVADAAEHKAEYAKLSALAADQDTRQGASARGWYAFSQAVIWGAGGLTFGYLDRAGIFSPGYWTFLLMLGGLSVGLGIIGLVWRDQFFANERAGKYYLGMLWGSISLMTGLVAFWVLGTDFVTVITIGIGIEALIFVLNGLHTDKSLAWGGFVFLVCFWIAVFVPEAIFEIFGIANGLGFGVAAWNWGHVQARAAP